MRRLTAPSPTRRIFLLPLAGEMRIHGAFGLPHVSVQSDKANHGTAYGDGVTPITTDQQANHHGRGSHTDRKSVV